MAALIDVILPVFIVLGFGYVAVWAKYFSDDGIDLLMKFTQGFAIPCLLFRAISELDLGQNFDLALLFPFYAGALGGFFAGLLGARFIFGRTWEDAVAIGFCGLFSNSVLLGLPITERAYGPDALDANYAIIAVHAPFCYLVGITAMEIARNRGGERGARVAAAVDRLQRSEQLVDVRIRYRSRWRWRWRWQNAERTDGNVLLLQYSLSSVQIGVCRAFVGRFSSVFRA